MKRSERDARELRRRAEERLGKAAQDPRAGDAELRRAVHELDVHQIELELQTEELRTTRLEVEVLLKRYTELFDFAPIGYFGVDADGTIREVNFAGARLLGLERGRLVGRRFHAFVSKRDLASFDRFLATLLASRDQSLASEVCELAFAHPRSEVNVRITAAGLDGSILSALLAVEDVTARKRAEDALREEGHRKDEFLAALSHELRNPLGPIRNGLVVLAREGIGGERARKAVAIIERQVKHLTRLVDDLLDVTRISRGKIRLHRTQLELGEFARRTIEDHRATFDAGGVRLESRIAPEPCWVDADGTRLAQVLGNLLGNAAKFTSRGGKVEVTVRREGPSVALVVRDDGIGIAPDVRDHLFQPFSQAPQSLERTRGGLGLGLATVKGLVELHGGTVDVASEGAGRGAEFTVRLPVIGAPAMAARPVLAPAHHKHHRVLVIDDNEDGAHSLKAVLELNGHEVRMAQDGPAGLAAARQFRPDIVICDIGLPAMDGYQVARALREDHELKDVFLIALSGYAQHDDVRRAVEAGFDRHLAKPSSPEALELLFEEGLATGGHARPPAG